MSFSLINGLICRPSQLTCNISILGRNLLPHYVVVNFRHSEITFKKVKSPVAHGNPFIPSHLYFRTFHDRINLRDLSPLHDICYLMGRLRLEESKISKKSPLQKITVKN
ncbi:hypothetical protein NPIL_676591 [Nephila pilipes]|uniref:Uncharacterized protein n=1 Tax=Nephila pilipes TaxID=299642 RepID=A0A8X6PRI5_NEPPI|nr:hypothetical protein NPIL_676591 [Nephila pilipes]